MAARIAALACASRGEVILAGRDPVVVSTLAGNLGVPWRSAGLESPAGLEAMLDGVRTVINTTGPFAHTAAPLMRACIHSRSDYLDLSNEAATFQDAWSLDGAAREAGIRIVPGAGFGTAAGEALATRVATRLGRADTLSIVRTSGRGPRTPGVHRTTMELLAQPGAGVRDGTWSSGGAKIAIFNLPEGRLAAIPVALGDAFAASRSTGVRNVTAYSSTRMNPALARIAVPVARRLAAALVAGPKRASNKGSGATRPESGETRIWVQAATRHGRTAEGCLQAANAGQLAAEIALEAARQLHRRGAPGFLTAGEVVGADYVPTLPGVWIVEV
jgi:short subunit dehydrogenase-like uncharacterized protein